MTDQRADQLYSVLLQVSADVAATKALVAAMSDDHKDLQSRVVGLEKARWYATGAFFVVTAAFSFIMDKVFRA